MSVEVVKLSTRKKIVDGRHRLYISRRSRLPVFSALADKVIR